MKKNGSRTITITLVEMRSMQNIVEQLTCSNWLFSQHI